MLLFAVSVIFALHIHPAFAQEEKLDAKKIAFRKRLEALKFKAKDLEKLLRDLRRWQYLHRGEKRAAKLNCRLGYIYCLFAENKRAYVRIPNRIYTLRGTRFAVLAQEKKTGAWQLKGFIEISNVSGDSCKGTVLEVLSSSGPINRNFRVFNPLLNGTESPTFYLTTPTGGQDRRDRLSWDLERVGCTVTANPAKADFIVVDDTTFAACWSGYPFVVSYDFLQAVIKAGGIRPTDQRPRKRPPRRI